jgi:hypothetical protein
MQFDSRYIEHKQALGQCLDQLGQRSSRQWGATWSARARSTSRPSGSIATPPIGIFCAASWTNWRRACASSIRNSHRVSPLKPALRPCYHRPFFKVEATALALIQLAELGRVPDYPVHLPPPFDDREAALMHFLRPAHIGTSSTLSTTAANSETSPRSPLSATYTRGFTNYINEGQDTGTGYWGPW